MNACPCGSEESYESCCEPYISGKELAPTAEDTMRARYTAYVKGKIDYIKESYDPKFRKEFDEKAALEWSRQSEWLGLEILKTNFGEEEDDKGTVEFIANYKIKDQEEEHHELAYFRRDAKSGAWYFVDGKDPEQKTLVREEEKIGRNDPCSCGSGKKYKKCCGK